MHGVLFRHTSILEFGRQGMPILYQLRIRKTCMVDIVNQGSKDNGKMRQGITGDSKSGIVQVFFCFVFIGIDQSIQQFVGTQGHMRRMFKVVEGNIVVHDRNALDVFVKVFSRLLQHGNIRTSSTELGSIRIKGRQGHDFGHIVNGSGQQSHFTGMIDQRSTRWSSTSIGNDTSQVMQQDIDVPIDEASIFVIKGHFARSQWFFGDLSIEGDFGCHTNILVGTASSTLMFLLGRVQPIRFEFSLSFGDDSFFARTQPMGFSSGHEQIGRFLRDLNFATNPCRFHTRCRIDGISKELKPTLFTSQDTGRDGSGMQTDS
mmetsp:Transcript_5697/g.16491  ORF Transcript_5697/g.16491 Transcript_5697/m.16491 type:complete len:317 (-) Transcript_5697:451-1401(-)